jgi:signal transduction histidine kinase
MSDGAKQILPTSEPQGSGEYKRNNRILVVEDEREIGHLYEEILGGKGGDVVSIQSSRRAGNALPKAGQPEFAVTVVASAEEALAQVKQAHKKHMPFAMGFFDVLLGGTMDGIELVREILNIQSDLYAVFVTAYHDRTVDAIRDMLGANSSTHWDYLNKPFATGEILQKARNFMSLWNLNHERVAREIQIAEMHRRLLEHERMVSVAAVSRGVSHEFGNILMQIMGKADLGRRKSESEMRQSLEKILEASQRASEILDRFKHLSSTSDVVYKKTLVNLTELLDEALDLMEHSLKVQKIKVCRIKQDSVEVLANATALLQVFVNVIINALHAMGQGGQLDFSVTKLPSGAEIRIRDYGPGVKPEILDRAFEAFFTTKGEKGTGLGLAISREIIEIEHRGEIQMQNHPVKGLEVVIRLMSDPLGEVNHGA